MILVFSLPCMCHACQTREGDLDEFFAHENQAAPPSLSLGGKLRIGTKADLLQCLSIEGPVPLDTPVVDALFIDGAAVVQMLSPGTARTFQEYANNVFVPYVSSQLQKTSHLDFVPCRAQQER